MSELVEYLLCVGCMLGASFGFIWFMCFLKDIPFKHPMNIVVKKCDHVNGLGEELPPTYTVWAKNIFGFDKPVFVEYQGWDWEGDYPYAKPFNSMDEVNEALTERQRNIVKSSCKIVENIS